MMIENIKAELSENAQQKLKTVVEDAVEKKIRKELKRTARKLTFKFIVTGAAIAGAFLFVSKAHKIASLLSPKREK